MTCSQLSCLIELKRLSEQTPDVASVLLTKRLKLSKPSVHRLLEGLKDKGLVKKEFYGTARLTKEGEALANEMLSKAQPLSDRLADGIVARDSAHWAALVLLSGLESGCFDCFAALGELSPEQDTDRREDLT